MTKNRKICARRYNNQFLLNRMKKAGSTYSIGFILTCTLLFYTYGRSIWYPLYGGLRGLKSSLEISKELDIKLGKLVQKFVPDKLYLIAIKNKRVLEVWDEAP